MNPMKNLGKHSLICGQDPTLLPLDPGSVKKTKDPDPGGTRIIFTRVEEQFFGLKYLNSLMGIRNPGWEKFETGIQDGQHSDPG